MSRRQATPTVVPPLPHLRWPRRPEPWGVALGLLSLFSALVLLRVIRGALGAATLRFLRSLFGLGAYPTVAFSLVAALWLAAGARLPGRQRLRPSQLLGGELLLLASLGLAHLPLRTMPGYLLAQRGGGGGYVGWTVAYLLGGLLGQAFAGLVLAALALVGLWLAAGLSRPALQAAGDRLVAAVGRRLGPPPPVATPPPSPQAELPRIRPVRAWLDPSAPAPGPTTPRPAPASAGPRPLRRRTRSARLPSLDLLAPASTLAADDAETRYQAQVIEETLAHFGVPAKVVDVQRGPAVTQYGVEPGFVERRGANGAVARRKMRVSRISTLSSDLALALAVPALRIEAPVPGRPLVGIEVPNHKPTLVNLRTVIESDVYQRIRSPLRVALGQGVSGRPAATDLAVLPHLLIAGATGSGKSVCINALITCLLLDNSPDALQLVLIDPKRVELTSYNGVPHLVAPVIVEVEETVAALRWLCQEMDQRYRLFARNKVRHIEGHNAAAGRRKGQRLPYLVVFVDELADLMMVAPEEVERSLCRLAQMGRATGIHLVVATQRPSVDVLTGLIKANFAARIAFAVSTQVDSRVILDGAGAEQLLGRGDMLFMSPEANHLLRLQGCFVSDAELAAVVGHWREAAAGGDEPEEEEAEAAPPWSGLVGAGDGDADPLLAQALELVRQQAHASTSFLQRRLRVGYSRAARLMEQLEAQGIVGPDPGGGRPRQVLALAEGEPEEIADEEER